MLLALFQADDISITIRLPHIAASNDRTFADIKLASFFPARALYILSSDPGRPFTITFNLSP